MRTVRLELQSPQISGIDYRIFVSRPASQPWLLDNLTCSKALTLIKWSSISATATGSFSVQTIQRIHSSLTARSTGPKSAASKF